MKKSLLFLAAGMAVSALLSGCASAAMDTEAPLVMSSASEHPESEIGEDTLNLTESASGSAAASQTPETLGNGRHISESFGDSEYFFKVEADIYIPDVTIQQGTMKTKSIDVSLIEQYLCDGQTLIESLYKNPENGISYTEYIYDGNSVENDLDYDINYIPALPDIPGIAKFDDFRLDSELSGTGFMPVNRSDWSDEQEQFVDNMSAQCQQLFTNLGIEAQVGDIWLETGASNDCCTVFLNTLVDGLPLIHTNQFLQSSVRIGIPGINNINFAGLFEVNQAEEVSILSIDEIMEVVRQGVEGNTINTYTEPIEDVRLAYMVNTETMEFYPVWCFCARVSGMDVILPRLGINAQTGQVAFMI